MFKYLRIAVLLTVLLVVAGNQWLTESRFSSWEKPLWITIYPVLADPGAKTRAYAESLDADSFAVIGGFLSRQAARYGRVLESPVIIQVGQPLLKLPPSLPLESSGLNVALWSLKMRWWSWRNGDQPGLAPSDIRMFVLYQGGEANDLLERSVGVQNGSYGVVNAIASRQMTARNRIVITHELLHILGASDKYDPYTGIFGMDFYVILTRAGRRVTVRRRVQSKMGTNQKVTQEEAKQWFIQKFDGILM